MQSLELSDAVLYIEYILNTNQLTWDFFIMYR